MKKAKSRMVLKSQSRELVLRVLDYFEKESNNGGPLHPITQVRNRAAAALGISGSLVGRITRQAYGASGMENNRPKTPNKKRHRRCKVTSNVNFDADAIRSHIFDFYKKKEKPTLKNLIIPLHSTGAFKGQTGSLSKVLKQIGFEYIRMNNRTKLLERHEVSLARCEFLRKVMKIENWSNVVFTGETWVNIDHMLIKTEDTTASIAATTGKGEHLIICHAGTEKGFIPDALLAFQYQKTNGQEMTEELYEQWFKAMLTSLDQPSIILIENSPYRSRQINKTPTQLNRKQEIINWLRDKGEVVDESLFKVELLRIVKSKVQENQYVIDKIASDSGHVVIRIPDYHCSYNAITPIWSQIKEHVGRNNTAPFSVHKMLELLKNVCDEVTPEDWASGVEVAKRNMWSDWERFVVFDSLCDEGLITNGSQESSDESSSGEEESDSE